MRTPPNRSRRHALKKIFRPNRDAICGRAVKDGLKVLRGDVLPSRNLRRVHATPARNYRCAASFLDDVSLDAHATYIALFA